MSKENKLLILEKFIRLIKNQDIKLISLDFNSNPNVKGIFGENKDIKRIIEFNLEGIALGEGKNKEENNLIFSGKYTINFQDSLEKEDEEEKLISANIIYELILYFDQNEFNKFLEENKFLNVEDSELLEIASMFFKHSGRLIIFPYVRHIIDMLMKEAGIITYPIKPLIFKR